MSYKAPFFYGSKASRTERDLGCEHLYWKYVDEQPVRIDEDEYHRLQDEGERVTSGTIHPTVKPVDVMEWLIEHLSEPGDTVLDPFAGSGTTGIEAMKTGRNCQVIDLDEDGVYHDIIEGRLHGNLGKLKQDPEFMDLDVKFGGEISDEHPNDMGDDLDITELFDL